MVTYPRVWGKKKFRWALRFARLYFEGAASFLLLKLQKDNACRKISVKLRNVPKRIFFLRLLSSFVLCNKKLLPWNSTFSLLELDAREESWRDFLIEWVWYHTFLQEFFVFYSFGCLKKKNVWQQIVEKTSHSDASWICSKTSKRHLLRHNSHGIAILSLPPQKRPRGYLLPLIKYPLSKTKFDL